MPSRTVFGVVAGPSEKVSYTSKPLYNRRWSNVMVATILTALNPHKTQNVIVWYVDPILLQASSYVFIQQLNRLRPNLS